MGVFIASLGPTPAATAAPPVAPNPPQGGEPQVSCGACIVTTEDGTTLWSRSARTPLPNASTTKMLTALVALRFLEPDEVVTVGPNAAATGGGGLALAAGDLYTAEDLMYALLLSSSNDAAVALAEHVAGTEAAFVDMMNRTAGRLGATDTHFVTSHGLDVPSHVSSARDLAIIGRALLSKPRLAAIVATTTSIVDGPRGPVTLVNRNPLLETYRGTVGIKTGYTSDAGNVLVAAATRRGRTVTVVAMAATDAADDARRLLDYGWSRLRRTVLVEADAEVGELVFDGVGAVDVVAGEVVRGLANPSSLRLELHPDEGLALPVGSDERVGTVVVLDGNRVVAEIDAVSVGGVAADEPPWILDVLELLLRALGTVMVQR